MKTWNTDTIEPRSPIGARVPFWFASVIFASPVVAFCAGWFTVNYDLGSPDAENVFLTEVLGSLVLTWLLARFVIPSETPILLAIVLALALGPLSAIVVHASAFYGCRLMGFFDGPEDRIVPRQYCMFTGPGVVLGCAISVILLKKFLIGSRTKVA